MKISYFIIGLIFLLNPNYGIIDVLPDSIGYFLMLYNPSQLSQSSVASCDSLRCFPRL